MSEAWSKLRDVEQLADGHVHVAFSIPLDALPRVRSQVRNGDGCATGQASFDRDRGFSVAEVRVSARAVLTCQRCMTPLEWPLESASRVALVADAAEADRVPADLETVRAPEHRLSVRDLVEEELLLAMPSVPRHALEDCAATTMARGSEGPSAIEEKHRPFERLDELLGRRT